MDKKKFIQAIVAGLSDDQLGSLESALSTILGDGAPITQEELLDASPKTSAEGPSEGVCDYGLRVLSGAGKKSPGKPDNYYTCGTRLFEACIGVKKAKLSDLSIKNLIKFHAWLQVEKTEGRATPKVAQARFAAMRTVWESALAAGIITTKLPLDQPLAELACLTWQACQQALIIRVCDDFAEILKRPPIIKDLTPNNVAALIAAWKKKHAHNEYMTPRKRLLEWFAMLGQVEISDIDVAASEDTSIKTAQTYMGRQTILAFFRDVYIPRRLIGPTSKNTIRLYEISIRKLSRTIGRPAVLSDFTDDNLAKFIKGQFARGLSPHTVTKEVVQLQCLWRFAANRRLVDGFPEIKPPSVPDIDPDAFKPEELERLFAAAKNQIGDVAGIRADLWWTGLVSVIYDSSERVGAILKAEWKHFDGEWLTVPAANRKGGKAGRRYKLRPETVDILREIKKRSDHATIFAWTRAYTTIWEEFGLILEAAGLPNARRGKFHKIRRTVATYYEAAGGNATKLLGHSTPKVTDKHYIDTRIAQTPQPADLVQSIIGK